MANRRKHESFNKIHSFRQNNYFFLKASFENIDEFQLKDKINEVILQLTNRKFDLNSIKEIDKAISSLSKCRNGQIDCLDRLTIDIKLFTDEFNTCILSLKGFETVRLFTNLLTNEQKAITMLEDDMSSTNSRFSKHFDSLFDCRDKLLDTMIQINNTRMNGEVLCKLLKTLIVKLRKIRHIVATGTSQKLLS